MNSSSISKAVLPRQGIPLSKLQDGKPLRVKAGPVELMIIKEGGQYHALNSQCTHMGGPLSQGLVRAGEVRCPWHHARFCLKTGAAVAAPALKPLQRYKVRIADGRLFLDEEITAVKPVKPVRRASRIVIVGAGAAGYACADQLLKLGFGGDLRLVNADRDRPYDRTACSKDYLAGKMKRQECFLETGKASRRGLNVMSGRLATYLDPAARAVTLDSGERLSFDHCVLAMGAEPQRPSLPVLDANRTHTLRTLSDADSIISASRRARSAAILGASFIALEVAAALRQRHLQVHVIAPGAVPLQKQLGSAVGAMIQRLHEQKGVHFHLGRRVVSYHSKSVRLDDGLLFGADFMVVGTGVKPRTQLAKDAGLHVASDDEGGGVNVNQRLQSSAPRIFAIGDIARYPDPVDPVSGRMIRIEHWVHAQRQGQYVARAILGSRDKFSEIPFFWSAHYDLSLSNIGHVDSGARVKISGSLSKHQFAAALSGTDGQRALLTCERDLESLQTEARWKK